MTDSPDALQAELASALANSTALITGFTPVPRRFNRGDVWTEEVQHAFIEALADTCSVEAACRMVGRSPASAYRLRRHPLGGEFAAAWQAAVDFGIRRIEDSAVDRAANGIQVPVFANGEQVGTRRIHNDQLTMLMLRSRLPERYCSGGARAMSAVDKRMLERLRKQWRAEWEKERRLLADEEEDGVAWMDGEIETEEDGGEVSVPLPSELAAEVEEPEREAEGDTGAEAEPQCSKPALELVRAQVLGAIEARVRQLEVREGEGDGRTAEHADIQAGQAPSVRCADTSPVNGGGFVASPPLTGKAEGQVRDPVSPIAFRDQKS